MAVVNDNGKHLLLSDRRSFEFKGGCRREDRSSMMITRTKNIVDEAAKCASRVYYVDYDATVFISC
jgi:hypothetical protein